jgi:hypothetical protein
MKILAALVLALAFLPAHAQQPRTIDFTQVLTGIDGQPVQIGADKQTATLSEVAINSLLAQFTEENTLPGSTKFAYYELARKVYKNKACELSADEIVIIRDRIAKAYPTMLAGPAIALLDPNWHPGLPAPGATPPPAAPAPGKR